MKSFFTFLLGIIFTLLLAGGGLYYYLTSHKTPGSEAPIQLQVPKGPGLGKGQVEAVPTTAGGEARIVFNGKIFVPPSIGEALAKLDTYSINIVAYHFPKGVVNGVLARTSVEKPAFPFTYRLPWEWQAMSNMKDQATLDRAVIVATICPNAKAKDCATSIVPHIEGFANFKSEVPMQVAMTPSKNEYVFGVQDIFITKFFDKLNFAACAQSQSTISGKVVPTKEYLARKGHAERIAIVAMPSQMRKIGPPFMGKDARTPTVAEMQQAGKTGIMFEEVKVSEGGGAFKLKVNPGFETEQYNYLAQECQPGEALVNCASRLFPINSTELRMPARGSYRLVPQNFTLPTCGASNAVFFLHDWKVPGGYGKLDDYKNANPKEIVDGLQF